MAAVAPLAPPVIRETKSMGELLPGSGQNRSKAYAENSMWSSIARNFRTTSSFRRLPDSATPSAELQRRMRLFRGVARTIGLLITLRNEQQFRQRLFGTLGIRHLTLADKQEHQEKRERLRQLALRRCSGPFILLPTSSPKRVWDVGFVIALFWVTVRVPYVVAFDPPGDSALEALDFLAEMAFYVDIILSFFTAYMHDGDLVTSPRRIRLHYLRGWFLLDLCASFPYTLLVDPLSGGGGGGGGGGGEAVAAQRVAAMVRASRLLRLVRLAKVEAVERRLVRALDLGVKTQHKVKLGKLFFYIAITAHVSACIWFYVSVLEGSGADSWTVLYDVASAPRGTQYLSALYYATATLTTVGYGDISAHTDGERGLALLLIVMGAALFAMMVGKMSALAQAMNAKEHAYQMKQSQVNQFLKCRSIPHALRHRVRDYYDYLARQNSFLNEAELLADMSPSLRRAISLHLNREVLASVPVFRYGGSGFQSAIVSRLHPTYCLAKEYILCAGEVVWEMHFLRSGSVSVIDGSGCVLRMLEAGSFFGETDILSRRRARFSVRAVTNCELFLLEREELMLVLHDFPEFEEVLRSVTQLREAYSEDRRIDSLSHAQATPAAAAAAASGGGGGEAKNGETEGGAAAAAGVSTATPQQQQRQRQRPQTPPPGKSSWDGKDDSADFSRKLRRIVSTSRTMQARQYDPCPRDLDAVAVPPSLLPIMERLAMNAHDTWAVGRCQGGWRWGRKRDNHKLIHPDLIPFRCLTEEVREYDRVVIRACIKMLTVMGYSLTVVDREAFSKLPQLHTAADGGSSGGGEGTSSGSGSGSGSSSGAGGGRVLGAVEEGEEKEDSVSESKGYDSSSPSRRGSHRSGSGGSINAALRPGLSSDFQSSAGGGGLGTTEEEEGGEYDGGIRVRYQRDSGRWAFYCPRPVVAEDVTIPRSLLPFINTTAEQLHDTWSRNRMRQGWRWGHHMDGDSKEHNLLLPYHFLTEEQKDFNRRAIRETVKTLIACGFAVVRRVEEGEEGEEEEEEEGQAGKDTPAKLFLECEDLDCSDAGSGGGGSPSSGSLTGSAAGTRVHAFRLVATSPSNTAHIQRQRQQAQQQAQRQRQEEEEERQQQAQQQQEQQAAEAVSTPQPGEGAAAAVVAGGKMAPFGGRVVSAAVAPTEAAPTPFAAPSPSLLAAAAAAAAAADAASTGTAAQPLPQSLPLRKPQPQPQPQHRRPSQLPPLSDSPATSPTSTASLGPLRGGPSSLLYPKLLQPAVLPSRPTTAAAVEFGASAAAASAAAAAVRARLSGVECSLRGLDERFSGVESSLTVITRLLEEKLDLYGAGGTGGDGNGRGAGTVGAVVVSNGGGKE